MHTLGLLDHLGAAADPARDPVGQALADEYLPQRVHLKPVEHRL
jgi:hypothetical protein